MADDGSDQLNRFGGLPLHRQLADRLRGQVLDGTLTPGAQLPTEAELEARYGVTRPTIRQALAQLRAEGWVETRQGAGSFVLDRPPATAIEITPEVHADASGRVLIYRHHPNWGLLAPTRIAREAASVEVARRLGLKPRGRVLVRDRLIGPEGGPVRQLATTYLPAAVAREVPEVARRDPGPGGFLAAIERHGRRLRTTLTVGARMPLPAESAALQLGPGRPLLVLWRVSYDQASDRPVEATAYLLDGAGWEVTVPLADRRRPGLGLPDPGPRPEPPGANPFGVVEPAHEADLDD
jgi:GntR family transcriptional regulator